MEGSTILFFDTTLRDGEQAPGYGMNRAEKLRLALQLETLGVDIIEAGFPIASEGDFESVREIAATLKHTVVAGLARAVKADIDSAAEAVRAASRPRIHTFLATSDIHLKYKLRMSRDDCLEQTRRMVAYARGKCEDVEFSAEDASRTDPDFLCRVVEAAVAAGATTVNIPDTVGYATPDEFRALVESVLTRVPGMDGVVLSVHCHDDLGMAVANTLAGVGAGARQVECTVCGIGERAGNAALEEVAMALATRRAHFNGATHNIRTTEITKTARLLSDITGVKVPPSKAVVGRNAFAHEAGIHQHGVLANALTYEIMTPASVGLQEAELVLGRHSGRHAFERRLAELGFKLPPKRLDGLFAEFKNVADRKKTVTDRDLIAIVGSTAAAGESATWRLSSFVVNSGNAITSTACVELLNAATGKTAREVAMATGPIYAAIKAVEKIIRHPFSLEDYQLSAVTEHRDALGEVRVVVADESGMYRGRGVSTDIIEASILACLSGINAMLESGGTALGTGAASNAQRTFENDMLAPHSGDAVAGN